MPYICVVKSHLCTPYVYVVKGSPVHHTSVSLRVISVRHMYVGYLYTIHLCRYYVHLMYVSLRGHLYAIHLCR